MSGRRRMLMAIANSYKWLPYSFEYLYHDLIPQKVNKNADLPQEYQEVEYIESSTTQRIDTGFVANNDTRVVLKYQSNPSTNTNLFWGSDGGSSGRFNLYYEANSNYRLGYGSQVATSTSITPTSNKTICDWNKNVVKIGNDTYTFENGTFTISATQLTLFSSSGWASQGNASAWKLYSCQIYDNGTLVRNFIPCYRKSDTTIGLYDSVNGVFYTNAGTGTFTKGNDVYRLVKNKAKVNTIYGNSVVENQLVNVGFSTTTQDGITFTNNGNGSFTISGTASAQTYISLNTFVDRLFTIIGHTYLLVAYGIQGQSQTTFDIRVDGIGRIDGNTNCVIASATNSANYIDILVRNGYTFTTPLTIYVMLIDLTQMFPFDTPTTLTDNRVQAILNRGYIPFNSGELKNVDIGGFESEPYNLFDEELEGGAINQTTGQKYSSNNAICSSNFISVLGGADYYFEWNEDLAPTEEYLMEYDKNKNYLGYKWFNTSGSRTLRDDTAYVMFYIFKSNSGWGTNIPSNINICFHRTGTRTGYSKHLNQLPTEYQEVEYLEATGTQYIDSGILPTTANLTKVVGAFALTDISKGYYQSLGKNGNLNFWASANTLYFRMCGQSTNISLDTNKHTYTLELTSSGRSLKFDSWTGTASAPSQETGTTFYLGALSDSTMGDTYWGKYKIYQTQIYEKNVLVRSLVPCFRKIDNVAGLYDLVHGVFYTNQGTGAFEIGKYVNSVSDLSFVYQGSGVGTSHDTMEIGKDNVVFTKDRARYTFTGSESWSAYGSNGANQTYIGNLNAQTYGEYDTPNILCPVLQPNNRNSVYSGNSGISIYGNNIYVSDNSNLTNKTIEYQLATPQVITIPRKHLWVVDLGTIAFGNPDSNGWTRANANTLPNAKPTETLLSVPNLCCSLFMTNNPDYTYANNEYISIDSTSRITMRSKKFIGLTGTQVQQALSGIFLFYETNNEVADIVDTMGVEAGGTFASYYFKWVENQLVNLGSGANYSNVNCTSTIDNTSHSIVLNSNTSGSHYFGLEFSGLSSLQGHKAMAVAYISSASTTNSYTAQFGNATAFSTINDELNTTTTGYVGVIGTFSTSQTTNALLLGGISATTTTDTFTVKNIMIIDLTLAFGAGNEPTKFTDYRIQHILKKGYIATNTNGTLTYEDNEVLANVDVKLKSK